MAKKILLLIFLLVSNSRVFACPFCNKEIRDVIYNSTFYPNLFFMLSAFVVLAVIVVILAYISNKRYLKIIAGKPDLSQLSPVPLTTAAMILGIGLGGFTDGIVLHQILQWHQMLSNKIPPETYVNKSINMFWDGIFHAFCLIVVIVGVVLLWKLLKRNDIDRSGSILAGGLLAGWGLFNIVEGIIDHHLLKLHNVFELSSNHSIANYIFLTVSVLMILVGYLLIKSKKRA